MTNISVLVLICALSACGSDELYDEELYRQALDPALCSLQLTSMKQLEFSDASFRAPEGLLVGHLASLGNYHQCLAIDQHFPGTNIQGKYCLIRAPVTLPTIRIPSLSGVSVSENVTWTEVTLSKAQKQQYAGKSLYLAVCVPKSCTVGAVLAPYTEHPVLGFNFTEQYCRLPDDKPFVAADYAAMVVFSLLIVLTIISTAYELRHTFILKEPKKINELFRICSLYTNTRPLTEKAKPLDCVDGIRSLSILWIIVLHTFCCYIFPAKNVINTFERNEWVLERWALWISSANLAVDSFFTLSGLLLVYSSVSKITQRSLLKNLHLFYLNRYLRLFPLLATAVLLQASLLHRVSDGPCWDTMANEVDHCRRYWWRTLLHVQNIFDISLVCLPQTWYLAVDMQLHIISPLVLYWVLGSRRAACTALATAILTSLAVSLAICFTFDLPTSRLAATASMERIYNYDKFYYATPFGHSPPFFLGMLFGYILHICKGQKIKLPWWSIVACHTLALGVSFYAVYILYPSLQADWTNHLSDNVNNTLRRACWSLALCWLIFACVHGYGGPVNWFLSLNIWKFVSRISYAMYLYHYSVQYITLSRMSTPVYFSAETVVTLFASDLVYTVLLSTAAYFLVEKPAAALQRILLRGTLRPKLHGTSSCMRVELHCAVRSVDRTHDTSVARSVMQLAYENSCHVICA